MTAPGGVLELFMLDEAVDAPPEVSVLIPTGRIVFLEKTQAKIVKTSITEVINKPE
jgi:hypothetical protein